MIAKAFDSDRPHDPAQACGWDAEKQMAFYLSRAFEAAADVRVFHALRFRTPRTSDTKDHTQIDHLVVHRHGAVIIESKATGAGTGVFEVDKRGQWTRSSKAGAPAFSMQSPVHQAKNQAESLRHLLSGAHPPLLNKLVGLLQKKFREFPVLPFVALSDTARLVGAGAGGFSEVMKAEAIVDALRGEIQSHRSATGPLWLLKDTPVHRGLFNLTDDELDRIQAFLLASHVRVAPGSSTPSKLLAPVAASAAAPEPRSVPPRGESPTSRPELPEALTCQHCRSIRVGVVYRRDYCLLCEECGKYTPLDWACRQCRKPASVRKRGADFFRACDKSGGCGAEVVFWRSS